MLNVCAFLFMVSSAIFGASSNNSFRSCTLPMYPTYGTYNVTSDPNAKPGQTVDSFIMTVSCRRGYGIQESGNHSQEVFCIRGVWNQQMPKCVRFCRLNAHHSMRYECRLPGQGQGACEGFVPPRTTVKGTCKPQFFSANQVEYMTCMEYGIWDRIVNCQAECGVVTPQAELQLVGGRFPNFGELPWHVGIYDKTAQPYGQLCGGSIITNNVVISAAHCFWDDIIKLLPETQFIVATAKLYRKWNDEKDILAQISEIKKIKVPSLFIGSAASFQQDIASLILKSPFTYLPYVRPVCYDFNNFFERQQLQHGNLGKVPGWGLTAANGGPSPTLKVADMPYVSEDVCVKGVPKSFRAYITGDKFCAGYTDGSSAVCKGDSGGGLVFLALERTKERFYLRGIVSASPRHDDKICNDYTYAAFTKISEHKEFILESIAEGSPMACNSYLFQCNDGSCVYPEAECNGIADCKDGSDESYENCTPGATTTTTTEAPGVCILPPYPEHGRYEVANKLNARPGFQADSFIVTVTCDNGYGLETDGIVDGTTSAEVYCFDGQWIPELPRCVLTDVVQSKYVYHPEINGWIKAHHFIATWEEAYQKCRNEEFATLASPITKKLRDVMIQLMGDHETQYFIGTSSIFYPGREFVSIEGVPLEDMEITNMLAELDPHLGQCLSMDGHKIRIVSCKTGLPFMCYKKQVKSMPKRNECGTRNNVTGYKFYPSTNSCYKLHGFEEIPWDDANKVCAEEGGHLVVINDKIEAEVVRGFVSNVANTNGHSWVTIGMRDRAATGDWITVHGERVEDVYNSWATKKSADDRYMCGRVYQEGTLDFGVCHYPNPYICEKDPYKVLFHVDDETSGTNFNYS